MSKEEKLKRLGRKIDALYALVTTWARKQGIDVDKVIEETRKRRRKRETDVLEEEGEGNG